MQRLLTFVPLFFLFAACGSEPTGPAAPPPAPSVPVVPTPGVQGFAAELDSLRLAHQIPGMSAAIVENERIVWSMGLGFADVAGGKRTTDTSCFHLASLTKPFASVVIMQLVEEGLLDLDDPVSEYGVDLSGNGVILVRHLLTHTSEGTPGSSYRYNGARFDQLGRVIQRASGRTFGELLVERILGPLQLRHTAPNVEDRVSFALTGLDRDEYIENMATAYELRGTRVVETEYASGFGPAAGLISSAEDMASFSIAIDRSQLLDPATWELVFSPEISNSGNTLPYGLGWFIQQHEGVELQWHYGYWFGTSTLIVRVPEVDKTFIVLANTDMMSRPYGLDIGDVLRSPFARLFLESYVFGSSPLPAQR
jgi:CubicO group peptidase (beta-lactamase class C family)